MLEKMDAFFEARVEVLCSWNATHTLKAYK